MRTVFIFAYYSYKDPVFQSTVLSYLFKTEKQFRFVLLTWEQKKHRLTQREKENIEAQLEKKNIIWRRTQWHSGRFKLAKKVYDLFMGVAFSIFLVLRYRAELIFSEGFPGAIIAHVSSVLTFKKHVIHTFEPHAQYMLESGVWSKNSWEYKLLKRMETLVGMAAAKIITGTEAYKEILVKKGFKCNNIIVAPSCIETNFYAFDEKARREIRSMCQISDRTTVICYLGKLGGMYMEEEIFDFFGACLKCGSKDYFFYVFTNEDPASVRTLTQKYDIPSVKIKIKFLEKSDVPRYLSASDWGFCGIRPIPSRRYSSPIKNGEYWANGLPVIIPKGISDDYLLAEQEKLGLIIDTQPDWPSVVRKLENFKRLDRKQIAHQAKVNRGIDIAVRSINSCLKI